MRKHTMKSNAVGAVTELWTMEGGGYPSSLHREQGPWAELQRVSRDPLIKHCVPKEREHRVFKMLKVWTLWEMSLEFHLPRSSPEPVELGTLFYNQ